MMLRSREACACGTAAAQGGGGSGSAPSAFAGSGHHRGGAVWPLPQPQLEPCPSHWLGADAGAKRVYFRDSGACWRAAAMVALDEPQLDRAEELYSTCTFGFAQDMDAHYVLGREVGTGGSGLVRLVTDKKTGKEYACKTVKKTLAGDATRKKREERIRAIKREVEALRRLKGCLNVVALQGVFEDDEFVHIVTEYCKGGELWHTVGQKHYSERTVRMSHCQPDI